MPRIRYKQFDFHPKSLKIIRQANDIIMEYSDKGYELTLRQLYYQFVSRDLIKNSQTEYKRLGEIINNARLNGDIDWNAIVDRTRYLRSLGHWSKPSDIIKSAASSFHIDMWANQVYRPELWIEKDALIGVFEKVCNQWDVPYFSCRGYSSQSDMWRASRRLYRHINNGQKPVIIHFGDHDPSGMDMTRDIRERLEMFIGAGPIERIALNMDQVEEYQPPPNPAKTTDSRSDWYIEQFGDESWELDALDPDVLNTLASDKIKSLIDFGIWNADQKRKDEGIAQLEKISAAYDSVVKHVNKLKPKKGKK